MILFQSKPLEYVLPRGGPHSRSACGAVEQTLHRCCHTYYIMFINK